MANRPQGDFFDPSLTAEDHAAQIRDVHDKNMAAWAEVELTPERLKQLQEQAQQDILDAVHPPNEPKPWEE